MYTTLKNIDKAAVIFLYLLKNYNVIKIPETVFYETKLTHNFFYQSSEFNILPLRYTLRKLKLNVRPFLLDSSFKSFISNPKILISSKQHTTCTDCKLLTGCSGFMLFAAHQHFQFASEQKRVKI